MGSRVWVRVKPSTHTITGSSQRSAMRKAWTVVSTASWLPAQNSMTQPESRTAMASCWSFQMFRGADTARLAQVRTRGMRIPEMS